MIYPLYEWLAAGFLTAVLMFFWQKYGIHDVPSHRSAHVKAIPTAAGACISITFLCFFVASCVAMVNIQPIPPSFLAGFLMLTVVGFFDDWKELNYKSRLLSHVFSVGVVLAQESLSLPEYAIWFFIGVGLINACNFLDGLNGFLATQWLLTVGFLLCGFAQENSFYSLIWISTLIYLFFNFPKARVFIGDTGSTILGFSYFSLIFSLASAQKGFPCIVIPNDGFIIFSLFPLAFAWGDVAFTIARRFVEKRSIIWSFADYGFHHTAKHLGNHSSVTLLYLAANCMLTAGLIFVFFRHEYIHYLVGFYGILQLAHWIFIFRLKKQIS